MATDKFNLLFLNSITPGIWGGLENWMELCGAGLARRGHRVVFAGRAGSQFLRRVEGHRGTETAPVDIAGDFSPAAIGQIKHLLHERRIDMVLCNFVKDVRLAGLAGAWGRDYTIVWTPGVNLAKKSLSHRFLFSRFVDHAIVPSRHLRDQIVASGFIDRSRFSVVPIGIDDAVWQGDRAEGRAFLRERFNLPEDAFICLTSGRFVRQKGHHHLIEAARPLVEAHPNIFFLFLGDGPLEPDIIEQIRLTGLTERVVLCGMMENHQRAVFGADMYVHPAVIEPFGIVLVEAMAASLPVVATRVGGIPEVVAEDETALLVDPAAPGQLTKAIERLYTEPETARRFGEAGFARYRSRFRLEPMIDTLEEDLRQAMMR